MATDPTTEPGEPGEMRATPPGRRRRGEMTAGRVLSIVLVAFTLAALINADALVERAERKPLGSGRDRSLAIWHPVQDLAHVLQLHRIRDLADDLVGNEARGSDSPTPPGPSGSDEGDDDDDDDDERVTTTTTEPARRPEVRAATAAAPLRVWVGGDSMMRDLSDSVLRLSADDPRLDVTVHYEISSGLTRPDYYDWPGALAQDMEETDAEIVVAMFGANDAQGIVAGDGTVYQEVTEPGWAREYRRRVDAVMDQLRADGRLVLWVLPPPMRSSTFDGHIDIVNDVYREAAEDRPWIELVETDPLFAAPDGGFTDSLPGADDLRQDDGIHLSRQGADRLATRLLALIDAELPTDP